MLIPWAAANSYLQSSTEKKQHVASCKRGREAFSPLEVFDGGRVTLGRCLLFEAGTRMAVFHRASGHITCATKVSEITFFLFFEKKKKEPEAVTVRKSQQSLPVGLFDGVE